MAKTNPIVQQVLDDLAIDEGPHKDFIDKADACVKSYKAIMDRNSKASQWTNKQHPRYVFQAIETMVGSLLYSNPKWKIRALPKLGTPEEVKRCRDGARANQLLLEHQLVIDHFAEKQRLFDLQALVIGTTVAKQFWKREEGIRTRRIFPEQPVHDMWGRQVDTKVVPELTQHKEVLRDDPTSEVIDARFFIPQQGADSLKRCDRVTHRCFYSLDKLKEFESKGYYGTQAGGQSLKDLEPVGNAQRFFQRESELWQTKPHLDDLEIIEQWREGGKRVVTVCEGLLLSDKPNPFWFEHLEHPYPFVTCAGTPDMFRIQGQSEVEIMAELQEMLWSLLNQRLDSLELLSNAIFLIADDVEDPESFEFGPGERWLVPRPVTETVKPWSPDPNVPKMTLEAEALLRGDIQNTTGGMPWLSGNDTSGTDQQTATGVSIVTSLAQKRLAAKRQQFIWAKGRIGEQWMALNQQYIKKERLIPVIGTDGTETFETVRPDMLSGDYVFDIEMADESTISQQRRAEATSKFQVAVQSQAIMAPSGTPLNLRAFMDDVLDAYDISDKERYYTAQQPQGLQQQQQQPQQPGQPSPNGVTNPALAAGMQSPSNPASMNPAVAMARAMSQQGGPSNAPRY